MSASRISGRLSRKTQRQDALSTSQPPAYGPTGLSSPGTATSTTYGSYEATRDASTVAATSARPVLLRSDTNEPAPATVGDRPPASRAEIALIGSSEGADERLRPARRGRAGQR